MYSNTLVSDFFVSSSLHADADSDTFVTISATPTVIEFEDTTLGRKFWLNSLTITNSSVGEVRFTINDDNSVYVLAASATESVNYLSIKKITMLTVGGKIKWKGLAYHFTPTT